MVVAVRAVFVGFFEGGGVFSERFLAFLAGECLWNSSGPVESHI